jgi:hypothetical protein
MSATALALGCGTVIASARRAVASGSALDLTGFDAEVALLCEATERLPPEERPLALRELQRLADALAQLAGELRERQAGKRGSAAQAYGRTPGGPR